jgi:hypothetical protein
MYHFTKTGSGQT